MAKSSLGSPLRNPQQAVAAPSAAPPGSDQIYKVTLGDAPQKGRAEAKVTIVEWSDFQCPYCGRVIDTLKQVERNYGSDVRFVFKHNPLPMHPDAPGAAKASIAAWRQGKFWEMHDKLFEANVARGSLSRAAVEKMAADIGLDLERFRTDLEASETQDILRSDQAQAAKLGATGTPFFFVNGARISGALPYESFKAVIDLQHKRAAQSLASGVSRK